MIESLAAGEGQRTTSTLRYKRIVIKLGSNLLTGGGEHLDDAQMTMLVSQVAMLHRQGVEFVIVTSGAIAAGRSRLGFPRDRKDIPFKQMLAAVGQAQLMQMYDRLFYAEGVVVAQTLLTRGDLSNRQRYLNARNTLLALLDHKVIPIVNENDVVAVDEIRFGDNDTLSALVANLVDADRLVIMTDIAGLFSADPRFAPDARLIPVVEKIDAQVERLAAGAGSARGTGGMRTKVEAAKLATQWGVGVDIVDGRVAGMLLDVVYDRQEGTRFSPQASGMESRKRWISCGLAKRGAVVIDAGAVHALQGQGRSLLPAGILSVRGSFARGDAIDIIDEAGTRVGCGISNYRAADVESLRGHRSDQIEATLGYAYGEEIIHRNNLVVY